MVLNPNMIAQAFAKNPGLGALKYLPRAPVGNAACGVGPEVSHIEPVIMSVGWNTGDDAEIRRGEDRTGGADHYGQANLGGFKLTKADATVVGGQLPMGQGALLKGLQIQVLDDTGYVKPALANRIAQSISVHLLIEESETLIGTVFEWPTNAGFGERNGNVISIRSFGKTIVVNGGRTFGLKFVPERDITALTKNNTYRFRCVFRGPRTFAPGSTSKR